MKVDFGVQVKGRIVDSAFTLSFDEEHKYDKLLEAVKAATEAGIRVRSPQSAMIYRKTHLSFHNGTRQPASMLDSVK